MHPAAVRNDCNDFCGICDPLLTYSLQHCSANYFDGIVSAVREVNGGIRVIRTGKSTAWISAGSACLALAICTSFAYAKDMELDGDRQARVYFAQAGINPHTGEKA